MIKTPLRYVLRHIAPAIWPHLGNSTDLRNCFDSALTAVITPAVAAIPVAMLTVLLAAFGAAAAAAYLPHRGHLKTLLFRTLDIRVVRVMTCFPES
jgi:hypothetical protein